MKKIAICGECGKGITTKSFTHLDMTEKWGEIKSLGYHNCITESEAIKRYKRLATYGN